jgi:uncharacterized protein YndB with AHSA1/START domain
MTLRLPSDLELETSRVLNAPRELVFDAYTRREHVREWWGQKDSTLPVCEIDLRPGGAWRFVEHAADGNEYPFKGEFLEVSPPERLVNTFIFDVEPFNARAAVVTITFEDLGARTRVTEHMRFETKDDRDGMLQSGMEEGAAQSYERLDALLARLADA